jgi:hypothetical protein
MRLFPFIALFAALPLADCAAPSEASRASDCAVATPGSAVRAACAPQAFDNSLDSFWWREMDRRRIEEYHAGGG